MSGRFRVAFSIGRHRQASLALAAVLLAGCGGESHERPESDRRPPVPAEVVTATVVSAADDLVVTGSVLPLRRAAPGTVLMGRVDEVLGEEGDAVRRGEPLATVDSREVTARLAQAEAAVAAARAMERNAGLMKERMERLYARQAAPRKSLDDALAGHEAAVANLRAAEEGVKAARMYVSYSTVAAPFDGVIVEKRVEAGDTAAPGVPLFVIEDTSAVKIEAQVAESRVAELRIGDPVAVEVLGATYEGRLNELLPSADPLSRTFTVRVLLSNPEKRFRSGMFARLRLRGAPRRAILVPEEAIVRRGTLSGVFVVDEDSVARLRWITLGRSRDGLVEVLTGLDARERVVRRPGPDIEDGRTVEAG